MAIEELSRDDHETVDGINFIFFQGSLTSIENDDVARTVSDALSPAHLQSPGTYLLNTRRLASIAFEEGVVDLNSYLANIDTLDEAELIIDYLIKASRKRNLL